MDGGWVGGWERPVKSWRQGKVDGRVDGQVVQVKLMDGQKATVEALSATATFT